MRRLAVLAVFLTAILPALAQTHFPPLDQWRIALASGNMKRFADFYSSEPPVEIQAKPTNLTGADNEVAFWNEARIQEFWKGDAFYEPDAQNLAYDLARIIVEQLATDWDTLKAFALAAKEEDAGAAAARQHLGVDLGEYVCALLEKSPSPRWSPSAH